MNNEEKQNEVQEFELLKDNIYYPSNKIELRFINPKVGLGVFATQNIKKDDLIERSPMIILDWRNKYQRDPQINRYAYTSGPCQCQECKNHGYKMFLILGYGMLYNHKDTPNGRWNFNHKNRYGDLLAVENIQKDQQIFVSYGSEYFLQSPKLDLK